MSPTSRLSTSQLHLMGYPLPLMTRSLNEGSYRLPSLMAPRTIKRASTAPTWLKPLYPPRRFLLQATFFTFGIKKVARTPWYQVASDLPVATASSPCTLIFSNVTASTTAQRTCTQWIMTPSASLVTVRKPHLLLPDYLARNLSPPGRLEKSNVIGTPPVFEYHPFRSIDFKEQAYIRKQAANRAGERIPTCGVEIFMDFAFMRSSTDDYKRPNKTTDRIVTSYDSHSSHLIIC